MTVSVIVILKMDHIFVKRISIKDKLYQQRIQKQKDYDNLKKNLDDKREQYAQGNSARKKNLTPAILELEKRTEQLLKEMAQLDISVRNEEIKKLKH